MADDSYLHHHEDDDVVPLDSLPFSSHDFDPDPDFSPSDLSLSVGPEIASVLRLDELSETDSITADDLMDYLRQGVEQLSIAGDLGLPYPDPNSDPSFGFIEGVQGDDDMGSTHLGIDLVSGSGLESGFGIDDIDDLGSTQLGSGLGLESGFGMDDIDNYSCGLAVAVSGIDDEFFLSRRGYPSESGESSTLCGAREHFAVGARLVRVSSDSEDDENEVNLIREDDCGSGDDYVCDEDPSLALCLESLQLEEIRDRRFDFDWEEDYERVDEREGLNIFFDDMDEDLDASIPTLVPSREDVGGERRNLEWQVLLNAPNFNTNVDVEHDDGGEYNYTVEYETLIAQFTEAGHALAGRPPASKSAVDDLPLVVIDDNNALCAICKDEIEFGGQAKQLPCSHHYHGDCILPWLGIRNTCPVCRYELPTDDPAYERRWTERAGRIY